MGADFIEGIKALIRVISILAGIMIYVLVWRVVLKSWDAVWSDSNDNLWKQLMLTWIFTNIGFTIWAFMWAWT